MVTEIHRTELGTELTADLIRLMARKCRLRARRYDLLMA